MSGSILGQDQINKINSSYPAIVAHVRQLLNIDRSAFGLMKIHSLVEGLDSAELHRIFSGLSFISPLEKRALVRAAVFQVAIMEGQDFVAEEFTVDANPRRADNGPVPAKVFTPPQFRLNVNPSETFHGERAVDTPAPAPVVTNRAGTTVHKPVVQQANSAPEAPAE